MKCVVLFLLVALCSKSYAFSEKLNSQHKLASFLYEGQKIANSDDLNMEINMDNFKKLLAEYFLSDKQMASLGPLNNMVTDIESHTGGIFNSSVNNIKHAGIFQNKKKINALFFSNKLHNVINFSLKLIVLDYASLDTLENNTNAHVCINKTIVGTIMKYQDQDIREFDIFPIFNELSKPELIVNLKEATTMKNEINAKNMDLKTASEMNILVYTKDKKPCCALVKMSNEILTSLEMKSITASTQSVIMFS